MKKFKINKIKQQKKKFINIYTTLVVYTLI